MSTRWERHTGKMVGRKWNQDPNAYRHLRKASTAGAALDVPEDSEKQLDRDLRALDRVQKSRPLKPPGGKP